MTASLQMCGDTPEVEDAVAEEQHAPVRTIEHSPLGRLLAVADGGLRICAQLDRIVDPRLRQALCQGFRRGIHMTESSIGGTRQPMVLRGPVGSRGAAISAEDRQSGGDVTKQLGLVLGGRSSAGTE